VEAQAESVITQVEQIKANLNVNIDYLEEKLESLESLRDSTTGSSVQHNYDYILVDEEGFKSSIDGNIQRVKDAIERSHQQLYRLKVVRQEFIARGDYLGNQIGEFAEEARIVEFQTEHQALIAQEASETEKVDALIQSRRELYKTLRKAQKANLEEGGPISAVEDAQSAVDLNANEFSITKRKAGQLKWQIESFKKSAGIK
jgi:hypothetical protein